MTTLLQLGVCICEFFFIVVHPALSWKYQTKIPINSFFPFDPSYLALLKACLHELSQPGLLGLYQAGSAHTLFPHKIYVVFI